MKPIFLLLLFLHLYFNGINQTLTQAKIGISVPIIWNSSEATYYRLGSVSSPSGNDLSYGLNVNYLQPLYKGFYGDIGIGYFKQNFKIKRPFNYYNNVDRILYSTQSYGYSTLQLLGGIGYEKKISSKVLLNGSIAYNYFYTYRQKYIINKSYKVWQVNKKYNPLGDIVSLSLGIERTITKNFSLGTDLLIPVFTHWNHDPIFINNYYSGNEQQIAINKLSAGIAISFYYNFLNQ